MEDFENALRIDMPASQALPIPDCRRLTGPGMLWNHPGGVLDVFFNGLDAARVTELWHRHARLVLNAVGWTDESSVSRSFGSGVNLAISAPMDQLYSAVFVAQTAWHFCAASLLGVASGDFDQMTAALRAVREREANPSLIALKTAAGARDLDVLCDDEIVSVGHGTGSRSWPVGALPPPDAVDWSALHNLPVALITGTNGKTTTTRLCAAIARAAGLISGLTSTDFVRVGDDILDHGDYSGPGGARLLLRDTRLETGFLEVARGGILRRGLPLRQARAAAVLNVAADHLGEYGVNTVADLAVAKFAVHRALAKGGVLVLNADDAFVVAEAARTPGAAWWFSLAPDTTQIARARESGQACGWLDDEMLMFFDGTETTEVIHAHQIPIALNGRARYNIANALAAMCLSRALGLDFAAIRTGLSGFQSNAVDNPGRCNEFAVNGARVFVDFAHNPHSIAAVTGAIADVASRRRFVMISHAGDRSDQDIRDLTIGAFAMHPDVVVAAELDGYRRGRALGEVPALIRQTSLAHGMSEDQVMTAVSPSQGAQQVLDLLQPGDLALLLVHSERDEVFRLLADRASSSGNSAGQFI